MVVVCSHVYPSVTDVLWLGFKTQACKILAIYSKGNIFKFRLNKEGKKNMYFQRKTSHISETVRDTA